LVVISPEFHTFNYESMNLTPIIHIPLKITN